MRKKINIRYLIIFLSVFLTLSCGSIQVGVVTPTTQNEPIGIAEVQESTPEVIDSVEETSQPTEEPAEDFSQLWVEYWNPKYNYGIALPAHWLVQTESEGGYMSTRSYDMDFFNANSIKGNWIGGEAPEGAVKLDFVPFEEIVPEQSLEVAISDLLGADPEMTVVLNVEKITIGDLDAVLTTTARPFNLEDTTKSISFRLSPELILLVAAYPNDAMNSSDVQTILNSLVLDKSTPIIKPTTAPHPSLTVKSDVTGLPTYSYATAWYGHITSLTEGEQFDNKVTLLFGAGEFGISGYTPEIETKIQSQRDATGVNEFVHLWGVLYCNVDDYNTCRLSVERVEYGDQYTVGVSPIDNWVGTIKSTEFNGGTAYVFELAEGIPVWYGINASDDPILQGQIDALSDSGTLVSVWGDLLVGVQDVNGTRIEVRRLDPPGPGGLPSSSTCDSGYLGNVDDMLDALQYNLEIGNYYPFSYMIGNPFVIGYWRSEGVILPREEAFTQLQDNYFPSPDEGVFISDPALFPNLDGMPLENMWGPDVTVAANLYSKGWGQDGQGEAILSVARCDRDGSYGYYWYGMLYAMGGFE